MGTSCTLNFLLQHLKRMATLKKRELQLHLIGWIPMTAVRTIFVFRVVLSAISGTIILTSIKTSLLGFISRENLRELLGEDCKEADIDNIIKSVDINADGKSESMSSFVVSKFDYT